MSFILADAPVGMIPRTVERALTAGSAFLQGAALVVNGSNELAECGADPALIVGFSLTPGGTDTSGFNILGRKEFPPNRMQVIAAQGNHRFRAKYMGALPANDGGTYGITKDMDNLWKVDFNKTGGSARVTLVGRETASPESQPYVIVTVLAANIQPI